MSRARREYGPRIGVCKERRGIDELVRPNRGVRCERVNGVGESVNSVSVVKRLRTKCLVKKFPRLQRGTVVCDLIFLDSENQLLARVVEVQADFVARRSDRFAAVVLELLDEVLVRVLGHAAPFVSVKEHVVNEERGSHHRLGIRVCVLLLIRSSRHIFHGPEALVKRTELDVNLHFVVLEGNERKRKARVAAEPELKRHVESCLGESFSRRAYVRRRTVAARAVNLRKIRVDKIGQLRCLANHFVVTTLLLACHRELIPDVEPVTELTVDALAANLNLNGADHLLTGVVQPSGPLAGSIGFNLGQSNLKVDSVGKVAVARNGAYHTVAEISLAIESLFDGFHSKVSVSAVSHFPESDLRVARKIDVLGTVSYKLH